MEPPFLHIKKNKVYDIRGCRDYWVGHMISRSGQETADGVYSSWSWNDERLRVRNCRYGLYHLYYFERQGEICISPSIPKLIEQGAPTELDEAGLSVALRIGFFISDKTPFRAIRALPPNTELIWKDRIVRVQSKRTLGRLQLLSRRAAVDSFIELLREAIKLRVQEQCDYAMPLSGGRDSRHILLQLLDLGSTPSFCVTAEPDYHCSEDPAVAAEVAAALSVPHIILSQPRSAYKTFVRKNVVTSFCIPFQHSWALVMGEYLNGRVPTIYDGIGGNLSQGQWLSSQRLSLYEKGKLEDLVNLHLLPSDSMTGLNKILATQYCRKFSRDFAIEELVREVSAHSEAANPISSFAFWNYSRRGVALYAFSILKGIRNVYCPYLDHDVHNLLASLPPSVFLGSNFHVEAIRRAFPKFSRLRFERKQNDVLRNSVRSFNAGLLRDLTGHSQPMLFRMRPAISSALRQTLRGGYRAHLAAYLLQLERLMQTERISG